MVAHKGSPTILIWAEFLRLGLTARRGPKVISGCPIPSADLTLGLNKRALPGQSALWQPEDCFERPNVVCNRFDFPITKNDHIIG